MNFILEQKTPCNQPFQCKLGRYKSLQSPKKQIQIKKYWLFYESITIFCKRQYKSIPKLMKLSLRAHIKYHNVIVKLIQNDTLTG